MAADGRKRELLELRLCQLPRIGGCGGIPHRVGRDPPGIRFLDTKLCQRMRHTELVPECE